MPDNYVIDVSEGLVQEALLAAHIAQGAREDGSCEYDALIRAGRHAGLMGFLGQTVTDAPGLQVTSKEFRSYLMTHYPQSAAEIWQEKMPFRVATKRPPVGTFRDDEKEDSYNLIEAHRKGRKSKVVMLLPTSDWPILEWSLNAFSFLAWHLEKNLGYVVITATRKFEKGLEAFPYYIHGMRDWRDPAALMAQVDLVIGNDTSGIHLAATLGRPTLAICGPIKPEFSLKHLDMVKTITCTQAETPCVGCGLMAGRVYHRVCDIGGCEALASIRYQRVAERAVEMLAEPKAPAPTGEAGVSRSTPPNGQAGESRDAASGNQAGASSAPAPDGQPGASRDVASGGLWERTSVPSQ